MLLAMICGTSFGSAHAQTRLEAYVAESNPCAGFRVRTRIGGIGVDRLKSVRIPTVEIDLRDDELTLSVRGTLACRTSDAALFDGDASARITAVVVADVSSCAVRSAEIDLDGFGGRYGAAFALFAREAGRRLESDARAAVAQACERLLVVANGAGQ